MSISAFSKATLVARLNLLSQMMTAADNAYKSRVATNGQATNKAGAGEALSIQIQEVHRLLGETKAEVEKSMKEEFSPLEHYNQKTVETTLRLVSQDIMKRFGHFPMAAALLELFIMMLETRLQFNASFLALRTEAACQDRIVGNPNAYGLNGEPKKP